MDVTAEIRATTRRFLTERVDSTEVRRIMATGDGLDRPLWSELTKLGLPGLAIPVECGGAGLDFHDLAAALEETGRALLPAPLLGTVLASLALRDGGALDPLPSIAAGDLLATIALPGYGVRARRRGHTHLLDGVAPHVLDGHVADLVVVAVGAELYLADAPKRRALHTLDQTRRLARLEFDRTPATRLCGNADDLRDLALTALAAEQVGGAARCLAMAVEYAKVRVQFGRPIGSFQAIQHRCADVLVAVESARSAAHHAAGDPHQPHAATLAHHAASAAYLLAAGENIQVHGGIGITWEHDAHLHLKRARSSATLFGSPAHHRDRLAELVVAPTTP